MRSYTVAAFHVDGSRFAGARSRSEGGPRQRHARLPRIRLRRQSHGERRAVLLLRQCAFTASPEVAACHLCSFKKMQETRTSDVHCLDLESWTWSEMYVAVVQQGMSQT